MGGCCTVQACGKPARGHGYCLMHYKRWRSHGDPLGGRVPNGKALEWFYGHVKHDADDCLLWPFNCGSDGYGLVRYKGSMRSVSRLMCREVNGDPPTPLHEAAHSCGKGHHGCVNPKHLRWATTSENHADKLIHDTHIRGNRHPMGKLLETDVLEIKRLCETMTQVSVAKLYGIDPSHVSNLVNGKSWNWL